ncbi:MAG: SdrD B-like domain-containing protein [Kiritimatiellae bacterium]|nr:SdrD B-like domain-containing protein [Kiritimatiellia bacterium]
MSKHIPSLAKTSGMLWLRRACLSVTVSALLWAPVVHAHNLDTRATSIHYADDYVALMAQRAGSNQPLVQVGDEFWVVIKTTPGPGTTTGVGGYQTFYVPPWAQVLDAAYVLPGASSPTGFNAIPLKGQSPIAIGDGPIGAKSTPELIGYTLPGTNGLGFVTAPVTAAGLPRGTIAGVYGDTGIFFSADPRTGFNTYGAAPVGGAQPLINNSGDTVGEWDAVNVLDPNVLGVMTLWDSYQLRAYGYKAGPAIDYPDQRGNAPWGLASAVAGPQSGYAWEFDYTTFTNTAGTTAQRIQAAIRIGPWQRIRYPGSQIASDQPGLISTVLGYAGVDASHVGYELNPENPLPVDTRAVRFAIGQLELGRPEVSAVKIRVTSLPSQSCTRIYSDAFGGDAGGTDNGKDHIWRYFDPTVVSLAPCTFLQKTVSTALTAPGDVFFYTIVFANNGTIDLPNITLTDTLPSGIAYVSASPPPSTVAAPVYTWNVGTVAAGDMIVITNWVKGTAVGTFFNNMTVRSGTQVIGTANQSVEVAYRSLLQKEKTVTPSTSAAGGTVDYTITVSNDGTGGNGVPLIVRDYLPAGFTFVSLLGVTLNGASITTPTIVVDAGNPAIVTFTVSQSIQTNKELVIRYRARVGDTVTPGTYYNSVELLYEGKRQPPIPEAPVTVAGGSIGDTIFRDWTNIGTYDAGEEGIPGVVVSLYQDTDTNGTYETLIGTRTTDANGQYLFTGLPAGNYQVQVPTTVGDYQLSADPNGLPASSSYTIALGTNEARLDADFGYRFNAASTNAAEIGDMVFSDTDYDGKRDTSEIGITNVTVWLYEDTNGNGVRDSGDLLIATTATSDGLTMDADGDGEIDSAGFYVFKGLDPDRNYIVQVDQTDSDLTAFFSPNPYVISTAGEIAVSAAQLLPGERYGDADFGFFGLVPGEIGDLVYLDANRNGTYDAGDSPLPDVTVEIYRDDDEDGVADPGEWAASTVTDLNGNYLFENLGPGQYIVKTLADDPDIPSGAVGTASQFVVVLEAGGSYLGADFPFVTVLDKTVDKTYEVAGGILTYAITPYLPGTTILSSASVSDAVPAGTTYYGNDIPTAASEPAIGGTGSVVWNLGTTVAGTNGAGATPGYSPTAITQATTTEADDTYLSMANSTTWYGGGTELQTRPANASSIKATLIKFALPSLNANDVVDRAVIRIMVKTARTSSHTVTLRRATTAWTEGTSSANGATWADSDGTGAGDWTTAGVFGTNDYDSTVSYGSYNAPYANGQTLVFNVTDLVRAWRAGTVANNGVVLIASGTDAGDLKFYSSEAVTPATPGPRLVVSYSTSGSGTFTVRDEFSTAAYNNDNGTRRWAGGWLETGDGGSPSAGNILITGGRLRVKDTAAVSIYRTANLSETTAATLSLDMANNTLDSTSDIIRLEASKAETATWITLDTYTKGTAAFTGKTFDLVSLLGGVSKVTRIRFVRVSSGGKTGKSIDFDNVQISYTTPSGGTTATRLSADTALLSGTRNVTITMTVLSDVSANVTPPTNLTVTTTGTASATKVSGPTPSIGRADSVGYTFTYVYQVSSSTGIGSVRFSGAPTGPSGFTFGTGYSQSVLTTAPLTFQAKVNDPAPSPGPVTNTASLTANSGAISFASPPALTATSASIGDRVWLDADGDGVQDTGEVGIHDVVVYVYADSNMDGIPDGPPVGSAVTGQDGSYRVQGLPAGNYLVSYDFDTVPAGYTASTSGSLSVYGLTSGQQYSTSDFGLKPAGGGTGAIGDQLWVDADNDGAQDAGESVLPGVTLVLEQLIGGIWSTVATTTTDTNGIYAFSGLVDGDYRVSVDTNSPVVSPFDGTNTLGAAMIPTYDLGGTNTPHQATVTLNSAQRVYDSVDFGYNWSASIGDYVWWDDDLDGMQDPGEQPISNAFVLVYYDYNGNGILDATMGDYQVAFARTDANGNYLIENLPPGTYLIDVYEDSITTDGVRDIVPTTGDVLSYELGAGEQYLDADFGYYEGAAVSGNVFWDDNRNAYIDGGELGLTNVTVVLTGTDAGGNPVTLTTSTRADGSFYFLVPEGNYTVTYSNATLLAAYPSLGDATTPTSYSFHAYPGEENTTQLDFGVDGSGRIGDTVFADVNGTPGQQTGEAGIAGVTLRLYANPDGSTTLNGDETLLEVTVTDELGNYEFLGLNDGQYLVQVVTDTLPPEYATTPTTDPTGALDSQGTAVISGGGSVLTLDFGYPLTPLSYSVGGTIYDDNGSGGGIITNGMQDGTEPGLAGVRVTVQVGTNGVYDTYVIYTDANGNYMLDGVPQGSDVIVTADETTLPSGAYVQSGDPDGGTLDNTWTITNVQSDAANIDFGYHAQYGSISGSVVNGDGDGVAEFGEPALTNVSVTLLYAGVDGIFGTADDTTTVTVTDASGAYSFLSLVPGNYRVIESDPAGNVSLADADGGNPNVVDVPSLRPGQNVIARDFEDTQPDRYLGNFIWHDLDGDGIQDAGEPGISNVTVRIYSAGADGILGTSDDVLEDTQITDADGAYLFEGLAPASYLVQVDPNQLPAGFAEYPSADLDGVLSPNQAVATVDASAGRLDVDFGYFPRAAIGNLVWEDMNGDGVQNVGEPVLTNVTVQLFDASSNLVATVVTDETGGYAFTNLLPGTYYVHAVSPDGYTNTLVRAGEFASLDSDGNGAGWSDAVVVSSGQTIADLDFGFYRPARVFGYIFHEELPEGIRDVGDSAVTNIGVYLVDTNGAMLAETYTDANGYYSFDELPPGSYALRFWVRLEKLTLTPVGTDPERNRIDAASEGFLDLVLYSGDGLTAEAEPYNVGLTGDAPLATSIAMRIYKSSEGVFLDFQTVSEVEADRPIIIYRLMPDGAYVELGRVTSRGGDQSYTIEVDPSLLNLEGLNRIVILDESDARHELLVSVASFAAELVQMTKQGLTLTWRSLPGSVYDIYKAPTPSGPWTLTVTEVYADGDRCSTIVPVNPAEPQAFFKIVMRQ